MPHLRGSWEQHAHRRLVEPFCGGLAIALALGPARALLNDVNPHLINFYRWVQRGLTISDPMSNSRRSYYAARDRFNRLLSEGREPRVLRTKEVGIELHPGDCLEIRSSGGGGWGPPSKRSAEARRRDAEQGLTSAERRS